MFRISALFSLFIILVLSYIIFLSKTVLSRGSWLDSIEQTSIPLNGRFPGLNIIGFVIPLIIAMSISLISLKRERLDWNNFRSLISSHLGWYLASIVAIGISFMVPTLSATGRTDYPFTIVVVVYLAINLRSGSLTQTALSSFVFGYLIGLVSDLQSQFFFTGYFGGGGFIDGDFMLPVFLCMATIASRFLIELLEEDEGKKKTETIKLTAKSHTMGCLVQDYDTVAKNLGGTRTLVACSKANANFNKVGSL
jgi:hypothetical protein